jgi:hypothetical protein
LIILQQHLLLLMRDAQLAVALGEALSGETKRFDGRRHQ